METANPHIAVLLLAAGSSSRLGTSKQLIPVAGEPMLLKSAKTALASTAGKVMVVLGANETAHRMVLAGLPLNILSNPGWEKGMGHSLKTGLYRLAENSSIDAVLIMVCDQPLLTAQHLDALIEKYTVTKSSVVASAYAGATGVPALFDRSLFPVLLSLEDGQGARKILSQCKESACVSFPGGEIDLDTPSDVERFSHKEL